MQPHQLVEVAALVAGQGPVLLKAAPRYWESGLEQYWIASRCRLDRWTRALKHYNEVLAQPGTPRVAHWHSAQAVLAEILTSEVLTRVWTALGCGIDEIQRSRDIGPVLRGVYIGHLEARGRVLNLMLHGQGFGIEAAVQLNHQRRRIERWTDMLLGYVQGACDAREFAFDASRMCEFAEDIQVEQRGPGGAVAWQMVVASLRASFPRPASQEVANADLNERIVAGVLSCFDPELFDSIGAFKSLWLVRMSNVAKDTQGMIDFLVAEEQPASRGMTRETRRRF